MEKVYERALHLELEEMGFDVESQLPIDVYYKENVVGQYFADLVVEDKVILEIKAAESITKAHEAQTINYLKATDKEVALILNFGPSAAIKRKVFSNSRKSYLENLIDQ